MVVVEILFYWAFFLLALDLLIFCCSRDWLTIVLSLARFAGATRFGFRGFCDRTCLYLDELISVWKVNSPLAIKANRGLVSFRSICMLKLDDFIFTWMLSLASIVMTGRRLFFATISLAPPSIFAMSCSLLFTISHKVINFDNWWRLVSASSTLTLTSGMSTSF